MVQKKNTPKKLYQPDDLGLYLVDTYPKYTNTTMGNFINYAVTNIFKPSNLFLNEQFSALIDEIMMNINSDNKVYDDFIRSIISNICKELHSYEACDIKLIKNIFSIYVTLGNIKDNFYYDLQVSDLEDEFICKYKLYLQNIDKHFLASNRGFGYILVTIFKHWDHLKTLDETYKMLSIIAQYATFKNTHTDYKISRLFEIIKNVDIHLSNSNKGTFCNSTLEDFKPTLYSISEYIRQEINSNYSNTVYLLLTKDNNFNKVPKKLNDFWSNLLDAPSIISDEKRLEEYKRLRNGFRFYFKTFEAQSMAEIKNETRSGIL